MDDARSLLPVPEPVPAGCVGACFSTSEADEWRSSDPGRYCDWVIEVDPTTAVATVSGAWRLWHPKQQAVLWSTGVSYEKIMALLRRANVVLRSDGLTANEALAARQDLERAAALSEAWATDPEVFEHAPEIAPQSLRKQALLAWAVAHALAIGTLGETQVRAGLWRSLARALACPEEGETSLADRALRSAAVHAECEVLRENARHHFEACRAGAARACAARSLERARAEHLNDQKQVCALRVETLQNEFDRINAVAVKVAGGEGRVFDSSLLCDTIPLPEV